MTHLKITEAKHMSDKSHANIKTHFFLSVQLTLSVISGFRCEVDENCALLGYNFTLQDGTDRMSRNFSAVLPPLAA